MAEQKRSGPSNEALAAFYRRQSESLRSGSNTTTKKAAPDDPLTTPGVPQPLPPLTGLDFIDRILYGLQGKVK